MASTIKVNTITTESGSTITIGESGKTISIPSGATLSTSGTNTFASLGVTGNLTVDTNTLYVDSTNNRVGIGTSSPAKALHVVSGTTDDGVRIESTDLRALIGTLDDTGSTYFGASGADFVVYTGGDTAGAGSSEKMRINSSGYVGIGTSSPIKGLEIQGTNNISSTLRLKNTNPDPDNIWDFIPLFNSGDLTINDDGTERMRIDSSGRVGIGTTSPSSKLDVVGNVRVDTGSSYQFGSSNYKIEGSSVTNPRIGFITNGSEAMRIDSSGRVGIGTTSPDYKFEVEDSEVCASLKTSASSGSTALRIERTASDGEAVFFVRSATGVGNISLTASSTAYNTSSDHRLKENVSYDFDATTRLKQLKPARFNFIADADKTVDGFLAHEVSSVVPEAITGTYNETETKEKVVVNANGNVIAENIEQADWETGKIADEDGNTQYPTDSTWEATKVVPVYQGIDQSKLVPLLVKTIQELEARITTLEANNP